MSAIAAFLALSTPAAFAQEAPTITMTPPVAAPAPQTPPTVPEPSAPTPIAAPETAQPPATQPAVTPPQAPKPVIRVPLEIEPAETAPAPKAAERAAPAPAKSERTAPRARTAAAPASAPEPAAETPSDAAPVQDVAPVAAPMTAAEPVVEAASPPPTENASAGGSDFPWELAGGAAALLIVGGAGLAFARRRRNERAVAEDALAYDREPAISRTPVVAEGQGAEAQSWVTPAYTARERVDAPRTTPAFAAAPSGSMGRHEAMALAGPTPDNPFATLSKRLKRARFLDRQERAAYDETLGQQRDLTTKPVSAWEIAQRPAAPAAQEQDVRRPEPGRGRPGLRPGFARN
ncbi:hypothetical protein GGR90_003888 [Sphingopyxis italica]|uniref:Uncharacterized protein n=1 Tax=Sphingopyxis italica TaxID=1129133 RepID=A0A7X6BBB5_9SPHN|nr:hypothetical protein [Sphingopyxis italica]NJB91667.1 hypothetical protein [Sphingopyxis italica]